MPIASIPERQVAPSAPAHWITPEEQLLRLAEPITDRVSTSIPKIIPDLGRLIALYAIEADWYIALENLDSIPLKIPPLPNNITQIHEGPCWIYGKDRRQKDSHILTLSLKEFGDLNHYQKNILTPYGEKLYPQQESHPFQIQTVAGNAAVTALTASRFPNTQWLYVTREPLPTSRGKTWEDQQEILDDVCEMAGRKYEPLTVQQACSAAFNLKAATGEDLFPQENTENDVKRTYTRLEGAIGAGHFIVGRMGPTGLQVAIALDTMSLSSIGLHAAVVLGKNGEF